MWWAKPADRRPKDALSLRGASVLPGPEPLSLAVVQDRRGGGTWILKATSAEEIDRWEKALLAAASPSVSDPAVDGRVRHVAHVALGEEGFTGLPPEW